MKQQRGRGCTLLALGLFVGALSLAVSQAQGAASPDKAAPATPGVSDPAPIGKPKGTTAPPVLQSGQTKITVEQHLTKKQETELLGDSEEIFRFVSKDSGLPIKQDVKKLFVSRDSVTRELRKKFDEDKSNKRMEQSELVLKKFGLLDRDFQLRPFLLSLLSEQIAGFYDNKAKTMNLLDWVPIEQQKPVMAHELTHALQDQKVGLTKWQDQEQEGIARNVVEDNRHIVTDETDSAREAVLEGQAMVSFADYLLRSSGKTLKDVPQFGDQLQNGAGDMSDSPVLARAPLILQQSLLFPYTAGLAFEQALLLKGGVGAAFSGVLDHPPNTTAEIMHPDAYLQHAPMPVMIMPDIHPTLTAAGYEPYDVGVMGELDVRMTTELFGGRPLAEALASNWNGGIYYAAQRKNATPAEKQTTGSLALLYSSQWKNPDSARSFFHVFEEQLPRQYNGLERREKEETDTEERVYSTREGDVLLAVKGTTVWISEGYELGLARKLREMIDGAQGVGPVRQVSLPAKQKELLFGLVRQVSRFGMMRAALRATF